jgi:hypothetical protein
MEPSNSSAGRKRYGICLNDQCEKYKQVQEIEDGDMECPCCQERLTPTVPPKPQKVPKAPKDKKPFPIRTVGIVVGVIVVVAGIVGACFYGCKGSGSEGETAPDSTLVAADSLAAELDTLQAQPDTIATADSLLAEAEAQENAEAEDSIAIDAKEVFWDDAQQPTDMKHATSGTMKLSYGVYTGALLNGYPQGQGRLTYARKHQINRFDAKGRMAKAGEYVIGEFANGFVIYGKLYDAQGNLLGSLNFGMGPEDVFDTK